MRIAKHLTTLTPNTTHKKQKATFPAQNLSQATGSLATLESNPLSLLHPLQFHEIVTKPCNNQSRGGHPYH